MKKAIITSLLSMTALTGSAFAVAGQEVENNVYPTNVAEILDQRNLHGATQAYLWSMSIAVNMAWHDANVRAGADWGDMVTYVTPYEKRDIITSNMTTPYATSFNNLNDTNGLLYLEVPAGPTGGIINDFQMRHIADIGLAGDDKGKGAKYLIVGPGTDVPASHDADFVIHSKTNIFWYGTRVLVQDEAEIARLLKGHKAYGVGSKPTGKVLSIGDTEYRGWNLRGMDHWKDVHQLINMEGTTAPEDAMVYEFLKRVGIEIGKDFKPTERQKKTLLEAEDLGFTMSAVMSAARTADTQLDHARYYEGKSWTKILNLTNYDAHIDQDTGVMQLDARVSYSHEAWSMSEGMTKDIVGVGSKYLATYTDADGNWLNGANDYTLRMEANVPAGQFWSIIAYDAETRTLIGNGDTSGVRSIDKITANPDGSVVVSYSADCSDKINCITLEDGKDFFTYFRTYAPKAEFFDKTWQLNEVQKSTSEK